MKAKVDLLLISLGGLVGMFVGTSEYSLALSTIKIGAIFLSLIALTAFLSANRIAPLINALPIEDRNVVGLFLAFDSSKRKPSWSLPLVGVTLAFTLFVAGVVCASAVTCWLSTKGI